MIIRIQYDQRVLDFTELESYEDFDTILSRLLLKCDFAIGGKIDGPESRIYELKLAQSNFLLINNPYGNLLRPLDKSGEKLLSVIASKLKYQASENTQHRF